MTARSCSQPGCSYGTSERCLEGFDPPSSCPYLVSNDAQPDEVETYPAQDLVDLPSGEALTERQAEEVAREDLAKVIIIAGPFNGGKTTILTSLFEAFQEAPFANFQFRGSRTLFGFERRCHLGRKESGADEADTTHTSLREGVVFLHLALAKIEGERLTHANLLLSDVSGELFRRLRDSTAVAKEFDALKRADHLCIVVDGEKIVSQSERQIARNDSRSILRSMIESGNLSFDCVIDVIFTKWDLVIEAIQVPDGAPIEQFVESTKTSLASIAQQFNIRFHEIAARPSRQAKVPFAHGLPTLLRSWMSNSAKKDERQIAYVSSIGDPREFNRFTSAAITLRGLEKKYDVQRI